MATVDHNQMCQYRRTLGIELRRIREALMRLEKAEEAFTHVSACYAVNDRPACLNCRATGPTKGGIAWLAKACTAYAPSGVLEARARPQRGTLAC